MTFSEYALGLYPFISYGKKKPDYFTELVGNFVKDGAMDSCQLLNRKPDTMNRYVKGTRTIQLEDAQYLYNCRDIVKYPQWVLDQMDKSESYDNVLAWLNDNGISNDDPSAGCFELLENILLNIINSASTSQIANKTNVDFKLIDDIQEKIKLLPRPANVPVPKVATNDERTYINELFLAYGDAEGMVIFSADDLPAFPEYSEDLEDRRIDFYAAETIRRGVLELGSVSLSDQFDVLKDETLAGVKDTAKRTHLNGFEHMLAVMEQAILVPVTNYILSASPYWISGRIKKGVCHHLVNDGKLIWVRRSKKK